MRTKVIENSPWSEDGAHMEPMEAWRFCNKLRRVSFYLSFDFHCKANRVGEESHRVWPLYESMEVTARQLNKLLTEVERFRQNKLKKDPDTVVLVKVKAVPVSGGGDRTIVFVRGV